MAENTGWQKLGFVLGGGAGGVREQAYQEGRYRTAQTESALASAREKQLDAESSLRKLKAREQTEQLAIDSGFEAADARLLGNLVVGEGGSDFRSGVEGLAGRQEMDFRAILGDPASSREAQFAAGQGVQGKALNPYDMMGAGDFLDIRQEGDVPSLMTTPLGETMADENLASAEASTELALRRKDERLNPQRYMTGAGGIKAPTGYMLNPEFDDTQPQSATNTRLIPISGGPADPNTPGKLGSRERQVILRVIGAARNTVSDLQNIMSLPSGASRGVLGTGIGGSPGASILDATVDSLKNRIADEETRDYNAMLGGFTTALGTIERQGLPGSDTLSAQYETLILRPEDTVQTKMRKLALVRQAVENGLEPHLYSNVLPPELEAYVGNLIAAVKQAVPFSPRDVALLSVEPDGSRLTIADIVNEAGANVPIGPDGLPVEVAVAAPGKRTTGQNADIGGGVSKIPARIPQGYRYTDPEDGQIYEYGGPEGGDGTNPDDWFPVVME